MKTLLTLLMAIAIATCLISCGSTAEKPTEVKTDQSTEAKTETVENLPDTRGIIGSHSTNIKLSLVNLGIPEGIVTSAPEEAKAAYSKGCHSKYTDPSSGVTFDYSMVMDTGFQIISASFGIDRDIAKMNDTDFLDVAKTYLGYCATMPYDAGDPEVSRPWIESSISSVDTGIPQTISIGDAKFELSGASCNGHVTTYSLQLSKVSEQNG